MKRATARLEEARASFSTRADGTMRIVAVADTHGRPHPKAAGRIGALAPDAILHGGDVGDLRVVDELGEIAPVFAVRGNIDPTLALPDAVTVELRRGDAAALSILLLHIAVFGPKLRADVAKRARDRGASLVVCGHSHVPFIGRDKGLVVFNPGSIGPKRFHLPIVFGVIDVSPRGVEASGTSTAKPVSAGSPRLLSRVSPGLAAALLAALALSATTACSARSDATSGAAAQVGPRSSASAAASPAERARSRSTLAPRRRE